VTDTERISLAIVAGAFWIAMILNAMLYDPTWCRYAPPEWDGWYECRMPWEWTGVAVREVEPGYQLVRGSTTIRR
jgi:hypothetical protein